MQYFALANPEHREFEKGEMGMATVEGKRFVVTMFPGMSEDAIQSTLEENGLEVISNTVRGVYLVRFSNPLLAIRSISGVIFAEEDVQYALASKSIDPSETKVGREAVETNMAKGDPRIRRIVHRQRKSGSSITETEISIFEAKHDLVDCIILECPDCKAIDDFLKSKERMEAD